MNDQYDLQTLLDLRQQEHENAEDAYAREVKELERRKKFVAHKRGELEQAEARREQACAEHDERVAAGDISLAQMCAFDGYLAGLEQDEAALRDALERAQTSVAQQKKQVEQAKQALIEATRELKAVEKHREKWEADRAKKAQRKRAAAMDEVAARRWMEKSQ